ncbi:MAG: hypothetical protein C4291_14805 [Candidatus Dadabacteria bacterium]
MSVARAEDKLRTLGRIALVAREAIQGNVPARWVEKAESLGLRFRDPLTGGSYTAFRYYRDVIDGWSDEWRVRGFRFLPRKAVVEVTVPGA